MFLTYHEPSARPPRGAQELPRCCSHTYNMCAQSDIDEIYDVYDRYDRHDIYDIPDIYGV